MPLQCDILLFVVTTTEKEQLEKAAKELNIPFNRRQGNVSRYYDLGRIGDTNVMALRTEMGPLSYNGSASRAIYAMIETGATGLVSLGMAFGIDSDSQDYGDLVVSRVLLPYDKRTVKTVAGNMQADYSDVEPHEAKPALIKMLEKEAEEPEWRQKVSFGAVLTGSAKIQCTQYRKELVTAFSEIDEPVVGGEMEGAGLLATCERSFPSWVVVKGITDFADERQEQDAKESRELACHNAARFVLQAIMKVNA